MKNDNFSFCENINEILAVINNPGIQFHLQIWYITQTNDEPNVYPSKWQSMRKKNSNYLFYNFSDLF